MNEFGWRPAVEQLRFLQYELCLLADSKPLRWFILFFEPSAGVLISYRIDRCLYLIFGPVWTALRVLAFPLFLFLRILSCRHEICFKAAFGRGLRLQHPTLGVVVHADAIVGNDCILSGGNSIGVRKKLVRGELLLGDNVLIGINACVLGPVRIGSRVSIGAGAVVVADIADDTVVVGVPARPLPTGISR